jgi:DNA uptake protein ComE-like DNA-binding protein
MLKCYFVDVKNINSEIPRSSFLESELDQLADLILEFDGLIRPLILRETGVEKYLVIEGHREYYAAVIAKQKNLSKAEMVNAFVLPPNIQQSAIDRLSLFTGKQSTSPTNAIDSSLSEQLSSIIAQQLQPILAQLTEHRQILDQLNSNSPLAIETKSNLPSTSPAIALLPTPTIIVPPKPLKAVKTIPEKVVKTPTKSKKVSALSPSIDPIKATNTLNLINTLNQDQLTLNMDRSGLSKAVIKLVPSIITGRNTQPGQRFDTWETIISAKISGLGNATIEKIIDKLT